jgi:3'(2'), 5'-bisphosphate nucleotidase
MSKRLIVPVIAIAIGAATALHAAARDRNSGPLPPPLDQLTAVVDGAQCTWRNPARFPSPPRARTIAIANTYLKALVSHDASHIRMAHDVCRMENGLRSAASDQEVKRGIETPALGGIRAIYGVRWFVEGPEAVAFYELDSTTSIEHIAERFLIVNGKIQEIEAEFATPGSRPKAR